MYAIHAIDHDLWQITLPSPAFYPHLPAAHPCNVYLLAGSHAPTLINVGHPTQHLALTRALIDIGVHPERIERVITTGWSIHLMGNIQAFPHAELFLYSPVMTEPEDYNALVTQERAQWESIARELIEQHGYDQLCTLDELDQFFDAYFPPVASKLNYTPLKDGHHIRVGSRMLEVLHTPGPQPNHICLWEPHRKELFTGDITLDGLPYRLNEVHSYLSSQQRLIDLEPHTLYPNYGQIAQGKERAIQQVRRGQRFLNNFLTNATLTLHGAPSLIEFAEQDLGYKPAYVPRFALTLLTHQAFFEELVRARGIAAEGQGLNRRYGTDLEQAPVHQLARHSPALMPLKSDDL